MSGANAPAAPAPPRLSGRVRLESVTDEAVVMWHADTAERVRISRRLYDRIGGEGARAPSGDADLAPAMRVLIEKGFFLGGQAADRPALAPTDDPVLTFACAPRWRPGRDVPDACVLGVPYDLSAPCYEGARTGPAALRQASSQMRYRIDERTGTPCGWFDMDVGAPVLRGVTLADAGDVRIGYGKPTGPALRGGTGLARHLCDAGALPVLIGGDPAFGRRLVRRLGADREVEVVRLSAAPAARARGGARTTRLGARGWADAPAPGRVRSVSSVRRMIGTGEPLLPARPSSARPALFVSVDASILDPAEAPAACHLVPGGLSVPEARAVARAVATEARVVAVEVTGWNPARDEGGRTALALFHVLVDLIDAVLDDA